jgi:hypothetical protein
VKLWTPLHRQARHTATGLHTSCSARRERLQEVQDTGRGQIEAARAAMPAAPKQLAHERAVKLGQTPRRDSEGPPVMLVVPDERTVHVRVVLLGQVVAEVRGDLAPGLRGKQESNRSHTPHRCSLKSTGDGSHCTPPHGTRSRPEPPGSASPTWPAQTRQPRVKGRPRTNAQRLRGSS